MAYRRIEPLSMMLLEAARLTEVGPVVLGSGLPLVVGAVLRRLKPSIEIILDSGAISPEVDVPIESVSDWRILRASSFCSMRDVLGPLMIKGSVKTGIIGCVEIDGYGGLNSTQLTLRNGQVLRFPGAGGATAIAHGVQTLIVVVPHEARRIVNLCQYVSTRVPGLFSVGERKRPACSTLIVTTKCLIKLNRNGVGMTLIQTMPGVSIDEVVSDFPSLVVPKLLKKMRPVSQSERAVLTQIEEMNWRH